jgi:WD40 repeat protein
MRTVRLRESRVRGRSIAYALLLSVVSGDAAGQQAVTLVPEGVREVENATKLALSSEGGFIAVAARRSVILLDAQNLTVLRSFDLRSAPTALAVDDAGARVFVADSRNELHGFDAKTGQSMASTRVPARPSALDVSPEGSFVAVGLSDGRITVLTADLRVLRQLEAPDFYSRAVTFVAWGQNGGELFAATANGATAYWGQGASTPIRSSSPNRTEIVAAARDFSGDMLAVGVKTLKLVRERGAMGAEAGYNIQVIDWLRGNQVAAIDLGTRELRAVAVAPLRTALATIDGNGELVVWNVANGDRLATVQGQRDATELAFSADGERLATLSGDRIDLWRANGLATAAPRASIDFGREFDRRKFEITTDATPLIARTNGMRVAILGLSGLGADSVIARSADNLLASQVAGIRGLTLVEKDALDRILREIRFQNSGLTTTDEAARIGSMLNASRVIVGSVSQLGSVVVISARVIGVETGGVLGAREIRCNQCRPEDLPDAIQLLARTLFEF